MLKIIEYPLVDFHLAFKYLCLILMLPILLWAQSGSKPSVTNLRTEYKNNPVGIDVLQPRLSWIIQAIERGFVQNACQIQAAETIENLQKGKSLLWDSGKVQSDQSIQVLYVGPALKSGQRVYWRVRIWDAKDKATAWSEIAFWEMGLLKDSDWQAKWIESEMVEGTDKSRPSPMFRKEFTLKGKVKTARAYVTAHGLYEMELNGQKVGDEVLTPGWTSYNKRLQFQTYDVTAQLKPGQNAVGATLGNGWYRGFLGWQDKRDNYGSNVGLLLQINIVYENGQTEIIGSDETWKVSTGPILMSEIYHGEIYDARLELDGWSRAGYADQTWKSVKVASHPKDILVAPPGLPVRKIQEIKPIGIIKTPKGETVVDMGQNMVGWLRLKVQGQAGHTVKLVHFEVLDKAGNVYLENLRVAKQTITYILKGAPQEVFEPHFTFQGFRYVAVENFPGTLTLDNLTGVVVHSGMALAGTFECSNPMLNQLQHNIQWGQKGNFVDVPTDCPQRDERMGWTGDAQVFAPTACFNHDVAAFYTKWLRDVAADQFENGAVPHVVPDVLQGGGSAAWADASVVVPWTVYLYYGDKRVLENQYESMKRWVGYMQSQAGDTYLWNTGSHFGDWLAFATNRSDYPGATTDKDLIATAYFAYSTSLVVKTAAILGKQADVEKYSALLKNIKAAFQQEFMSPNGRLSSHTQTAYSLALAFDLIPENLRARTAERLVEDVRKFKHITTGFVGANLICPVLGKFGYFDEAFMLLNRQEYPSWLYPITKGATTIWERWDGIKPDGSFQDKGMNSFNHYAYGAIGEWIYRVVVGIELDEKMPGYKHIVFQPHPGGELTMVKATHQSMYGQILAAWNIANGKFTYKIQVPPNTTATVHLPKAKLEGVSESGKMLSKAIDVTQSRQDGENVVVEVGSGAYEFVYSW